MFPLIPPLHCAEQFSLLILSRIELLYSYNGPWAVHNPVQLQNAAEQGFLCE